MSNENPQRGFLVIVHAHRVMVLAAVVMTTAVTAVCAVRLRADPAVYACCYFSVVGCVLGAVDVMIMRLPDVMTLSSYPVLLVMIAAAAADGDDFTSLMRSVEASALLLATFAALCAVSETGLGDLKLAGLVGLLLGYFGWHKVFHGLLLAFVFGACWVAGRRLSETSGRRIPLGPFLVAGTLAALLA